MVGNAWGWFIILLGAVRRMQRPACLPLEFVMLDIDGFLTSTDFLTQIASIIVGLLSALFSALIGPLFGGA